jgi:hypothetical protein
MAGFFFWRVCWTTDSSKRTSVRATDNIDSWLINTTPVNIDTVLDYTHSQGAPDNNFVEQTSQ